jgi:hypothetical protein
MNGWSTIEDVPAEYREAVDKLCLIDLVTPVPPMQNFTFRYEDGE